MKYPRNNSPYRINRAISIINATGLARFLSTVSLTKNSRYSLFRIKIRELPFVTLFLIFNINAPGVIWPSVGHSSLSARIHRRDICIFAFNAPWSFVTVGFIWCNTSYIWISCISIKRLVSRCNISYRTVGLDSFDMLHIFVRNFVCKNLGEPRTARAISINIVHATANHLEITLFFCTKIWRVSR